MLKKSMLDLHRVSAEEFKQVEKIPVAVVLDDGPTPLSSSESLYVA